MTKTVYIEDERGGSYHNMWRHWGWSVTDNPTKADVIQFTGGADVSPELYGEAPHPRTAANPNRDDKCMELFKMAKAKGKPMAGICRGGQFLNVANGGKMFQHCDGHGIYGTHKALIIESGLMVDVTSTHHQIMRPNRERSIVLMEADRLGQFKEYMENHKDSGGWYIADAVEEDDVEAVYYDDTNSLCFQPHPEYCEYNSDCQKTYRYFLRNYLGLDV